MTSRSFCRTRAVRDGDDRDEEDDPLDFEPEPDPSSLPPLRPGMGIRPILGHPSTPGNWM
ncbi:hypothetical protein [Haloarchaeobius sp. DFWS5]|uniref:hypothetical protein n=1 Tax=Haloarchaeobius sp. DFWS5 TaxID=3446114 RepID=UPI003EB99F1C